jgi:hypothetical protein
MGRYELWLQTLEDPVWGEELRSLHAKAELAFPLKESRKWFNNYNYTTYPLKKQLQENGLELILAGWKPPEPFITPETRVLAIGSCFAATYAQWLAENGYNQEFTASCRAILANPFENAAVIAQLFRFAFGELDPSSLLWVDKEKQQLLATEERRLAARQVLLDADVLVITLALSELWYDKVSGEPLWRVLPSDLHDPERHAYKVLSFAETTWALETIDRIRAQWLPKLRIIYTVPPMPLWSTFRPISAVTANSASKAIVRGALDEFLRSRSESLNRIYYYFPSYEFVTTLFSDAFKPDARHLWEHAIDAVLRAFTSAYMIDRAGAAIQHSPEWAMSVYKNALQERCDELQGRCDELDGRCHELDGRCHELAGLCNELDKHCLELTRICNLRDAHIKRLKRRLFLPRVENWWRQVRRRTRAIRGRLRPTKISDRAGA